MDSQWKDVVGFENCYEVNKSGDVKRKNTPTIYKDGRIANFKPKILKTGIDNRGYVIVRISKNKVKHNLRLHVILAKAFIPNPKKKQTVKHKDGNKMNNSIENLQWMTYKENMGL